MHIFQLKQTAVFLTLIFLIGCATPDAPTPTLLPPPPTELAQQAETAVTPQSYPPPATPSPLSPAPPTNTPFSVPYPAETSAPTQPPLQTSEADESAFIPIITNEQPPTATLPPTETAVPPTPTPTPIPTLDFAAIQSELLANNQQLAHVKIGFHVGVGGNARGLEQWMRQLDAAGVPFFLKSVDNAQPILIAQQLMAESGVPHVLVYRKTSGGDYDWDVPNYSLPPADAAAVHWQAHTAAFPPELDRSRVWLETINEVDKNRAEWLGQFALATAELALRDGYNWAAFGWSSGEPEPTDWQTPSMLAYLRLAGANPDRLAVALHEYSYITEEIDHEYPFKVGRFQELFRIADANGIPRPTVLITEWGWEYENVPPLAQALDDIRWAAELYAPYPQIKGAAIWYLGNGFNRIADQAQRLIQPVTVLSLQNYYAAPIPPNQAPINPDAYQR